MLGRTHSRGVGPLSDWEEGPERPEPPEAEVHVWGAKLDGGSHPPAGVLAAEELERLRSWRSPAEARRFGRSHWALRVVLGRYLSEAPGAIAFELGPQGKPELAGRPRRLRFNLSHSGELALVAVSSARPVGVDVERIDDRRDILALAAHSLEPSAAAAVRETPPERRVDAFYRAWVEHEARLKCHGGGLGSPAPTTPVAVAPLRVGGGYAAAVAAMGAAVPPRRLYRLDLRKDSGL